MFNRLDYSIKPSDEDISKYINNSLWDKFKEYMRYKYGIRPVYEFSKCSMEYGWNIKFKKGSKSLCTIYPRENYFAVLIVIGKRQKEEFEKKLENFTEDIQQLYFNTKEGNGQRWLFIEIEDDDEKYNDVKNIIKIRSENM